MSISGLLTTMHLPELLQWVKFSQKTGTLIFERRGVVKKVFVEKGLIVSASSNDPKEYLGQILICFGLISEASLNEAFKLQAEKKQLLGKILCEAYNIKEAQIMSALRIKIEETIYDIFLWDDGKFIFQEGIELLAMHDRLETAITIDHVMFEGARRVDEWKEFKKTFPGDDIVFRLKAGAQSSIESEKDFITKKILKSLDGEKSLRRIMLETHAPEYRGTESFAKLYWGGMIEVAKKSAPVVTEKSSPRAALAQAMDFFKGRLFEPAYQTVDQFLQAHPEDEEAHTLYRLVQEAYLNHLREVMPSEGVPKLNQDFSLLSEKIFTSREGFLASRVNGQWDIKSLVMVSPLGELESLRIFKKLADEGVIQINPPDGKARS